jgi:hypothetical protein
LRVVDSGDKFAVGIIDTSGKFAPVSTTPAVLVAKYVDTGEYFREFSKFEMILMLFSGAWGKMIHERNLKQKIS